MSLRAAVGRHRGVVLGGAGALAVVLVLAVLTVLNGTSPLHAGALDPQNPRPDGARALARVLDQRGVRLSVVRRVAALDRAAVDGDTTLVVTSPGQLGRSGARTLDSVSAAAGALVLAAPDERLLDALHLPLLVRGPSPGGRVATAGCPDHLLARLRMQVDTATAYRSTGPGVTACFTGSDGDGAGLVSRVAGTVPTYVVGGADAFANGQVREADNAAVALRLLGQRGRLVWYVPDRRDVAAGDGSGLAAQLPRGLVPALALAAAAVLATMLWRGRRLGPLVSEPLPVVVRALESTQGRGRLYRRVQDRGHAAGILRAACARRLADRLGVPAEDAHPASPGLLDAVAHAAGRAPADVADLLERRPVPDDRALTRLATDLSVLEKEVLDP